MIKMCFGIAYCCISDLFCLLPVSVQHTKAYLDALINVLFQWYCCLLFSVCVRARVYIIRMNKNVLTMNNILFSIVSSSSSGNGNGIWHIQTRQQQQTANRKMTENEGRTQKSQFSFIYGDNRIIIWEKIEKRRQHMTQYPILWKIKKNIFI